MPKNVSTPIWACKKCGSPFGDHYDAALRCESAPVPDALPTGTPLLTIAGGEFILAPLTPSGVVGTRAAEYNTRSGHFHHYRYSHEDRVESDTLRPGVPGSAPQRDERSSLRVHTGEPHRELATMRKLRDMVDLPSHGTDAWYGKLPRSGPRRSRHRCERFSTCSAPD